MDIAPVPLRPKPEPALSPASDTAAQAGPPAAPVVDAGLAGTPDTQAAKPAYPPPAPVPTQQGPEGIRFDFNLGARVLLPPRRDGGLWRVRLRDLDTGNVLFESESRGAFVSSNKRWFVRFRIEVWSLDQGPVDPAPRPVLSHDFDTGAAPGREVLIHFPVGTLGDILAWFPYAVRFAGAHPGCRVTCALSPLIIPLLRDSHPHLRLVTHEQVAEERLAEGAYATYHLGLFFDDRACDWQPTDFRRFCQGLRHRAWSAFSGERQRVITQFPGCPARSSCDGETVVGGDRRERVGCGGCGGGESCAARRRHRRTGPLISGT